MRICQAPRLQHATRSADPTVLDHDRRGCGFYDLAHFDKTFRGWGNVAAEFRQRVRQGEGHGLKKNPRPRDPRPRSCAFTICDARVQSGGRRDAPSATRRRSGTPSQRRLVRRNHASSIGKKSVGKRSGLRELQRRLRRPDPPRPSHPATRRGAGLPPTVPRSQAALTAVSRRRLTPARSPYRGWW